MIEQPGVREAVVGAVAVARRAVLVDVQDIGARSTGGDRQVGARLALPPPGDLGRVGARVVETVPRGRLLGTRLARKDRPPATRVGQRQADSLLTLDAP